MQQERIKIAINEIFPSIDGEVNPFGMGGWSVFIRFQGCSASCSFCDTEYARGKSISTLLTAQEIVSKIRPLKIGKVTITGGEPMEQAEGLRDLLEELERWDYNISVETNGYQRVDKLKILFPRVSFILDCKLENIPPYQNFIGLQENDYVKFLVADEIELRQVVHRAHFICNVGTPQLAISPIRSSGFNEATIVKYILDNELFHFSINTQLHKLLNLK